MLLFDGSYEGRSKLKRKKDGKESREKIPSRNGIQTHDLQIGGQAIKLLRHNLRQLWPLDNLRQLRPLDNLRQLRSLNQTTRPSKQAAST